jgi:hypothetical protein
LHWLKQALTTTREGVSERAILVMALFIYASQQRFRVSIQIFLPACSLKALTSSRGWSLTQASQMVETAHLSNH